MKKIFCYTLLFITLFIASPNVLAKCNYDDIQTLQGQLDNFTFNLTYADDYIDMNGDFQEGYFRIMTNSLPEGFSVSFSDQYNLYEISNGETITLKGGVYEVEFYNSMCEDPIKSYELKIPYYKQYCELNGDCEDEEIWFDGTYENKAENQNKGDEKKVNTRLVVVLVSLIVIIIVAIVILVIRKRRFK